MRLLRLARVLPLFFVSYCAAEPEAQPEADPDPDPDPVPIAEAEAQTYSNNAPFSGAIYIVNPNGQGVTTQSSNMCPSYASTCTHNTRCCPSGYTCASGSNGLIGCCPSGNNCGGSVNAAAVTTVTVYGTQQTSVVYVQPQATTVVVYNQPTTVNVYNQPTQQAAAGGFCSTLTMNGPDLPRVTQGSCGTILIVSEGTRSLNAVSYGVGGFMIALHFAIARVFHWI